MNQSSLFLRLAIFLLFLLLSVWSYLQISPLQEPDPSWFVVDEGLAFLAIAVIYSPLSIGDLVASFFLFRFWDIVKLWPADALERIPNGWGLFADDGVAACYTLLCLIASF